MYPIHSWSATTAAAITTTTAATTRSRRGVALNARQNFVLTGVFDEAKAHRVRHNGTNIFEGQSKVRVRYGTFAR